MGEDVRIADEASRASVPPQGQTCASRIPAWPQVNAESPSTQGGSANPTSDVRRTIVQNAWTIVRRLWLVALHHGACRFGVCTGRRCCWMRNWDGLHPTRRLKSRVKYAASVYP